MATSARETGQLNFYLFLSIFCVLVLAAFHAGFEWVVAIILVILLLCSYVAIKFFLPGTAPKKDNAIALKTGSVVRNQQPSPKAQKPKKPEIKPKHFEKKLDEQRRQKEKAQEDYKRLRQRITAQFPQISGLMLQDGDTMDSLESGLLQKEGFLQRIEALAPEGFNVPEAGIGLEQSLMHLYGIELYAFLKALEKQKNIQAGSTAEAPTEEKQNPEANTESKDESESPSMEAAIEEKCALMNRHLRHVELVNMGLQVPYSPASHQAMSGTPKQGMPVEVCSFKILNRRGQGQLLKALVRIPKA